MSAPPPDPFDHHDLRCLVGPTASGKTALALRVAEAAGAEIFSLDSMLVYRGMDIGTAKPTVEERARVPHHLIDLVDPSERYDVQRFLDEARRALERVYARGRRALFVGGTGFYLAALLRGLFQGPRADPALRATLDARFEAGDGEALHAELSELDPVAAERIHAHDRKRLVRALEVVHQTGRSLSDWQREWGGTSERESRARLVGLHLERDVLDGRIEQRCEAMLEEGWREEACRVRGGAGFGPTAIQALGYAEVLEWADGLCTREEARERIARRTRRFARRQATWYRKFAIEWLPAEQPDLDAALAAFGW